MLEGMTQETWNRMTPAQRHEMADTTELSPQLLGWEGYRVEVVTDYGERRRFIVGKSTGWKPIHLEISRRNAHGGPAAERHYASVRVLYFAR